MRVLVTGTAGFIGFHVARRLLADGHEVTGLDGMTPYYDVALKHLRHDTLKDHPSFRCSEMLLEDMGALEALWRGCRPQIVIHLAAQAGVRYSLENPRSYVDSNLVGTFNIIETARRMPVEHLLIASTSSVYGANGKIPFEETDKADSPVSIYAATKKATELMTHSYSHLFGMPVTAFRFFTVYGPFGRPDMALFKFVSAMLADKPIDVYNHGRLWRDFTFIDDIVEAIVRLVAIVPPAVGAPERVSVPAFDTLSPAAPHRVVNIGNAAPVELGAFIEAIETALGRRARRNNLPMQPGDVVSTHADTRLLEHLTGFRPRTPIAVGVARFVDWYLEWTQRVPASAHNPR